MVEALNTPLTREQYLQTGLGELDLSDAIERGYVSSQRKGTTVLYSATYSGRRSYSVVKTDNIIAYTKAVSAIAGSRTAERRPDLIAPKWEPARQGANDHKNIRSKGH